MSEKLQEIVADIFDLDESMVLPQTGKSNVDSWDSLNHLSLMTAVEKEFRIRFTMAEIEAVDTVEQLQTLIEKHRV